MMPIDVRAAVALILLAAAACTDGSATPLPESAAVPVNTAPASVGGAGSLEQALEAFRTDLPAVTELAGGESSREALVQRFVRALERSDTADLRAMVMTRAEFAHLYYPGSVYTRPPTRQAAPLVWFFHLQESQKGVTRVLRRFGGSPVGYASHRCAEEAYEENGNRLWHQCAIRFAPAAAQGDTIEHRLFGPVIERGGLFKLYSDVNDY